MTRLAKMSKLSSIGMNVPRVDAYTKVTGSEKFASDIKLPKMLYAKILRSPYPHAKLMSIDTSKVESVKGVKAVICGKDAPWVPFGPSVSDQTVMAIDKVRFVGEPVAAVAALEEDIAEESLSLIEEEYEELVLDSGKIINANFTDYKIPQTMGIPEIVPIIVEVPHMEGPFGAKGLAEVPVIPMAPAIANAIYNAVGVRITELPITPERILKALHAK